MQAIKQQLSDIVFEAMTNATKYSRATRLAVSGQTKDHTLSLSIRDDGSGRRLGQRLRAARGRTPGRGPRRANANREPAGRGTSLEVTIHSTAFGRRGVSARASRGVRSRRSARS